MAFSDMQKAIAGELARLDLTTEIQREINNTITFYGNKAFWFNEACMSQLTTVQGQRYYALPSNFASVLDVLSTLGNYTYRLEPRKEQYLDQVDWGNDFWSGSPTYYSFWNGQIRLFPLPQGGLPVTVKGTVIFSPQLSPHRSWRWWRPRWWVCGFRGRRCRRRSGGSIALGISTLTSGTAYPVVIGSGGNSGSAGATGSAGGAGGTGGSTTFNSSTLVAAGGAGGNRGQADAAVQSVGNTGGTGGGWLSGSAGGLGVLFVIRA